MAVVCAITASGYFLGRHSGAANLRGTSAGESLEFSVTVYVVEATTLEYVFLAWRRCPAFSQGVLN